MTAVASDIASLIARADCPWVNTVGDGSLKTYLRDHEIVPDATLWDAILNQSIAHPNLSVRAGCLSAIVSACEKKSLYVPPEKLKTFIGDYFTRVSFSDEMRCGYISKIFEYFVKTHPDLIDAEFLEKSAGFAKKIEHPIARADSGMGAALLPLFAAWGYAANCHPEIYVSVRPHREFETMMCGTNDPDEVFIIGTLLLGMVDQLIHIRGQQNMPILSPSARAAMAAMIPHYDKCNDGMRQSIKKLYDASAAFESPPVFGPPPQMLHRAVEKWIAERVK